MKYPCTDCEELKEPEDFPRTSYGKRASQCKACKNRQAKRRHDKAR